VAGDDLLDIVEVVAVHVFERVDSVLDVAGHGDVDEEQRPAAAGRGHPGARLALDNRVGGAGRGAAQRGRGRLPPGRAPAPGPAPRCGWRGRAGTRPDR